MRYSLDIVPQPLSDQFGRYFFQEFVDKHFGYETLWITNRLVIIKTDLDQRTSSVKTVTALSKVLADQMPANINGIITTTDIEVRYDDSLSPKFLFVYCAETHRSQNIGRHFADALEKINDKEIRLVVNSRYYNAD